MKSMKLLFGLVVMVSCLAQAQTTIQLGSGTASTSNSSPSPVNIYYASSHLQMLYTAAELTAAGARAGRIQKLGFYIEGAPTYALPNFTVKIRHSTAVDAAAHDPGPFTQVYRAASYAPVAGKFDMLPLETAFLWNGRDNIALDVCFDRVPNYASTGTVRYYSVINGMRYVRSDGENTCGITTSAAGNEKPQLQLEFAASLPNDAGLWSFDAPKNFCPGTEQVKVSIANFGSNVLNNVQVNWSVNGVTQTPFNFTQALNPPTQSVSTATVTLGNFAFAARQSYLFRIWTSNPNGTADPFLLNDTLTTPVAPGLSGEYTIGGSNPDFTTFTQAVQALMVNGVCQSTVFKVRNGTYQEQLELGKIPGASEQKTVTFQSDLGAPGGVILTYASKSDLQHSTFMLKGTEWLSIRNITIEATDNNYGRALSLTGGASHNTFEGNHFRGPALTYSSGSRQALVFSGEQPASEYNVWKNNLFVNGAYGLYLEGISTGKLNGIQIENNRIDGFYTMGIYGNYLHAALIKGNAITTNSTYSSKEGLHLTYCSGSTKVLANRIFGLNSGRGIYLYEVSGTDTVPVLIANNFIHVSGQQTSYGVYTTYGANQSFLYNSVNMTNTVDVSAAFYLYYGTRKSMLNNILVNKGEGYALLVSAPASTILRSDHNDLYVRGSRIADWNGPIANLAAWQQTTKLDSFSLSQDPLFLADTNFHVAQIALNGAAEPDPRVTTDLEGNPRHATLPDIGADEFDPPRVDAGLNAVATATFPFAPGSQAVWVVLKNFGVDPIRQVTLNWSVNDTLKAPVNWTGTLNSKDTLRVQLGSVNFLLGKAYSLKAWTSQPNGQADIVAVNDTTALKDLYAGLGGNFTIGGTSPHFLRLEDAANTLNKGGVYASVTFLIRNGTYTEQVHFGNYPGAGSTNPVVFQSESGDSSGVVVTFNNSSYEKSYIVEIQDSKWLTFRKLTFRSGSGYYTRIFLVKGAVENLAFENLRLIGESTTSGGTEKSGLSMENAVFRNLTVRNNTFLNASYGIYLVGNYSSYSKALTLENNIFQNQYIAGIYLRYLEESVIRKNTVQSNSNYYSYYGINLAYLNSPSEVSNNIVKRATKGYGLYIESFTGTAATPGKIFNNYIQMEGSEEVTGINLSYSSYQHLYHNTVNMTNTHAATTALYGYSGRENRLVNNILANSGGGYVLDLGSTGLFVESDYNDLYTTGIYLVNQTNKIGNLADWQAISSQDAHSLSINPRFVKDTSFQVTQIALNKAGKPIGITTDIEGQSRDIQKPDIGADEFTPPGVDAGLEMLGAASFPFPAGEQPIIALLKNYGTNPLQNLRIEWKVNGAAQTATEWTGLLLSNDTIRITLGKITFNLGQPYSILAWTKDPNGQADPVTANDTLKVDSLYAGLGGTYTLGGSAPNFATFTAAATQLTKGGVYAPVIFQVRNGTYTEQLQFGRIPGSDASREVTFQSAAGDSTTVILTFPVAAYDKNYVVRMTGTSWVRFKKFTLRATGSSYTRVLMFADGAHHNTLENMAVEGPVAATTSDANALVYSYNDLGPGNQFIGNRFTGGSYGLYLYGPYNAGNYIEGLVVEGNQLQNQYYRGMYLVYQSKAGILRNTISTTTNYSGYSGIYWSDGKGETRISRNKITGIKEGSGIYLNYMTGTMEKPVTVDNNFIHITGTLSSQGLVLSSCTKVNVLFNSVHLTNTNTDSKAYYNYYGTDNTVLNNIFANNGGGYAYYNYYTSGILRSDYNDLYTSGANLGYWGANVANLAQWRTTARRDSNSVSVKPRFASDTDLHLADVALDKTGIPLTSVTTDIDGDTRDPVKPDIGADEFYTSANDASIVSIVAPKQPFAATVQAIKVNLFNNGLDTLRSVQVNWLVNGVSQTPLTWTGKLLSGQALDSLTVGLYPFLVDSAYAITVYASLPNGQPDLDNFNDTARVSNLYAALGGIYTIGGTVPDFPTFNRAVRALTRGGVVDAVTFKVRNGTYTEQVSIPAIVGASQERAITFESELGDSTQVILNFQAISTANFTLQWKGAHWMRFRKMTIEATDATYGRVLDIQGKAGDNRLENCFLKTKTSGSSDDRNALVYSGFDLDSNNVFLGNYLLNGSYGFLLQGQNEVSTEPGTVIARNRLVNQYYMGMYLYYQQAPLVSGNEITTTFNNGSFRGISVRYARGPFRILGNYLRGIQAGAGIITEYCQGQQGMEGVVANNFIQIGTGANYSRGIFLDNANLIKVYYNTVRQTSSRNDAFAFGSSQGSTLRLLNNIFANTGGGWTMDWQNAGISVSNFNDLYTTGNQLLRVDQKAYTDLVQWRTEGGFDLNSYAVDPLFTSLSDLHAAASELNGGATPVPEVTTDFDGQVRDAQRPDIGADEFFPVVNNDAGIAEIIFPSRLTPFAAGEHQVKVALKNNGADTLYNFGVQWLVDNIRQPAYGWSGKLIPGQRDTVVLGMFDFKAGLGHEILAYTVSPNGKPDLQPANDSALASRLFPALAGMYTIGGSFPDFNNFTEAVQTLNEGGVLGQVTFKVRDGIYTEQIAMRRIRGASPANNITFRSESGNASSVTLRFDQQQYASNYLLLLDDARYLTFQNMSFRTAGTSWATLVELRQGASYNKFTGNTFRAENKTGSALVYSAAPVAASENEWTGNVFENGAYGLFLAGAQADLGTIIDQNQFSNQVQAAIYLRNQQAPAIRGNKVTSQSTDANYFGIYAQSCSSGMKMEKNQISAPAGYGIWMNDCRGAVNAHTLVSNNFVHVAGTANSTGIYANYGEYLDLYYNSVNLTNTDPNSRALAIWSTSHVNVLNNILVNSGGGYAVHISYTGGIDGINFNDYYVTGSKLGFWNSTNAADLAAWKALTGKDNRSVSADPLFVSASDLHSFQPMIDSMATPLLAVKDDIDGQPRDPSFPDIGADEFRYLLDDIGVTALLTPASGCETGKDLPVKIRIQNYSGKAWSNFNVAYRINEAAPVVQNVGSLNIKPGATAEFTFSQLANLSAKGTYHFSIYTLLPGDTHPENDTLKTSVRNLSYPATITNMLPANGASGLTTTIAFSWAPSAGATAYDFFLWKNGETRPGLPTAANIPTISYWYRNTSLSLGAVYNWQIVARNDYCSTPGPVQTFTLIDMPDLVVRKVQIPANAFSGQTIDLNWEVHNTGKGSTGNASWFDAFYLSADPFFNSDVDPLLSSVSNFSALESGQSYANKASVQLPDGISGEYYIFVRTDAYTRVPETEENNNFGLSLAPVNISLTPPPDLQVTSILAPNNVFSGSAIAISWTVANKGSGTTRAAGWTDQVYFGKNPVLDQGAALLLGKGTFSSTLKPDSSYARSITATLPDGISGTYYVHVVTDFFKQEYEHAAENNNTAVSSPVNVILTPPADLIVSSITLPASVVNGESFVASWTVENQGGSPTKGTWRDGVYLSSNPSRLVTEEAIFLGAQPRYQPLQPSETYNASLTIKAPEKISGPYYLYVHTDMDDKVYEFNLNGNNIRRSTSAIAIQTPDLSVTSLQFPAQGNSGDTLTLKWNLNNPGEGKLAAAVLTELVLLSPTPSFNPATAVEIGRISGQTDLNAGASLVRQLRVTLPNGIQGNHYLFVWADPQDLIFENGREANNRLGAATPVAVTLSPWLDLEMASVTYSASSDAGQLLQVQYEVRNKGTRATRGETWRDRIYLSNSSVWNANAAQLLRELIINKPVALSASYINSTQVNLPASLRTGNYYLFVWTDADDQVFEYNGENNNRLAGPALAVKAQAPVDLAVESVSAPSAGNSGAVITVQWQVKNRATASTISPLWADAVYLSADTNFNADADMLLDTVQRSGPLEGSKTYSASAKIELPDGLSGTFYLFAVTDFSGLNNDANRSNNHRYLRNVAGNPQPVQITLTPPADLVVSALNAPSPGIAGQTIRLIWKVRNQGTGPTAATAWADRVFLSADFNLDGSDLILGTQAHEGALAGSASYSDTLDVFLPVYVSGNRILMVATDVNNAVYEHQGEGNNLATAAISIIQPPPSDLQVANIMAPDSALAGETATFRWTLRNEGQNPASGQMQEAIYLSKDPVWDVEDALLGTLKSFINLAPLRSEEHAFTTTISKVASGNFYILVRTDILNNILESDDANNLAVSGNPVFVGVRELLIGVTLKTKLANLEELYYRIEVPPALQGETMLLTLVGDTLTGANELYLRYGDIPDRVLFDFSHGEAYAGRQEIIVPELRTGTYYLMVRGLTRTGNQQNISLLAEVLVFQVRRVQAAKGGNAGQVTLRIDGSKFESGMTMKLQGVNGSQIMAGTVLFIDRTRVFATFDLRGYAAGRYNLTAVKTNGTSATLTDAFTIESGGKAELLTNFITPASTRPRQIVALQIDFANAGILDLPQPSAILSSLGGAPIALTIEGLDQQQTELELKFSEKGGPPGILRPGSSGSIIVYARADAALFFTLINAEIK